jgi:hypothetical protein
MEDAPSWFTTLNFSLDSGECQDAQLDQRLAQEFLFFRLVAFAHGLFKKTLTFLRYNEIPVMLAVVVALTYYMIRKPPVEEAAAAGQCRDPSLPPPQLDAYYNIVTRLLVMLARLRLLSQLAKGDIFEPFFGYEDE